MTTWGPIARADTVAAAESARRRGLLAAHALGELAPALDRYAAVRGPAGTTLRPEHIVLAVFAGDHGIAYGGVTAAPPPATAARITELAAGDGPIAQLADAAGISVRAVDIAVRSDLAGTAVHTEWKVRRACGRIDMQDAMNTDELTASIEAGRAVADREINAGADLLVGAVCGVGVDTPAAALTSLVTGIEPVAVTSRGDGIDDLGWINKCTAVRDARFRARAATHAPAEMLRIAGGPDLTALAAFIAQAAARRTPVLVDDTPSLVAAALADRLAPGAGAYVVAANTSTDRTGAILRDRLGLTPLLDQRLALGSGAGALLAAPLLRTATGLLDAVLGFPEQLPRTSRAVDDWDPALL